MSVAPGILPRLEPAPHNRMDAEYLEIVGGYDAPSGAIGPIADAERGSGDVLGEERLGQRAVPPKILKVGPGDLGPSVAIDPRDRDQPVLVDYSWKRPQQNSFDPTENRCCRADPEGQAEDSENRKARIASEHSDSEAKILKHVRFSIKEDVGSNNGLRNRGPAVLGEMASDIESILWGVLTGEIDQRKIFRGDVNLVRHESIAARERLSRRGELARILGSGFSSMPTSGLPVMRSRM
jgi:hypothetical protein